jgi:hypothetical protein
MRRWGTGGVACCFAQMPARIGKSGTVCLAVRIRTYLNFCKSVNAYVTFGRIGTWQTTFRV